MEVVVELVVRGLVLPGLILCLGRRPSTATVDALWAAPRRCQWIGNGPSASDCALAEELDAAGAVLLCCSQTVDRSRR